MFFLKSVLIKSKAKNTLKCILKGDTVLQKYRIQDTKNFLTNTERSTDTFCSRRSNELKKIILFKNNHLTAYLVTLGQTEVTKNTPILVYLPLLLYETRASA